MNSDSKIRHFLLKPLTRRSQRTFDWRIYSQALRRLDDRALGEVAVRQLRDVIASLRSKKHQRNDPVRARERVALAKALYASRRISRAQYVFFAVNPVEAIHEARHMDGGYKGELGPIERALEAVEKKHGLGPDQYWPRGQGPQEHVALNKRYEAVLDAKFRQALGEFGLDDLADLLGRAPAEFERLRERGRRAVFHNDEYIPAIQDVVIQYETEARRAAEVGAYSAAVTSLGAGVEGLLLLRCLRSRHKATRLAKALPTRLRPRSPEDPSRWSFEILIEVCLAAGWLRPIETSIAKYDAGGLAHFLRFMRNYVHPGRHARERPWSTTDESEYLDAAAIYAVMISLLGDVRQRKLASKAWLGSSCSP
jgi:hypothetical protein